MCALLPLPVFLTALSQSQERNQTDAQRDDLDGPVASVSTTAVYSHVKWQQPDGPTLLIPIWCWDCEYDRDGTRTKSGNVIDGSFAGQITKLIRDENGHVTDQLVIDTRTRQIDSHAVMGPFGKTAQINYINGKEDLRQTFSYDQYGHMTDWVTFDSTGRQKGRTLMTLEPDGTLTERSSWGENGQLSTHITFDPDTAVEHYTTFDQFGIVKLTFTMVAGELSSFWESPDSPTQPGDNFTKVEANGDHENYACNNESRCNVSDIHYEYLDPKNRNPLSAEWRDSENNLRFAVYYNYQADTFRNWTRREVWVWSSDLGKRTLYETDSRQITYWEK